MIAVWNWYVFDEYFSAWISSIFPYSWNEHFNGVAAILMQASFLISPILSAPVLYPTIWDAPFTTYPGVTDDVITPGV